MLPGEVRSASSPACSSRLVDCAARHGAAADASEQRSYEREEGIISTRYNSRHQPSPCPLLTAQRRAGAAGSCTQCRPPPSCALRWPPRSRQTAGGGAGGRGGAARQRRQQAWSAQDCGGGVKELAGVACIGVSHKRTLYTIVTCSRAEGRWKGAAWMSGRRQAATGGGWQQRLRR